MIRPAALILPALLVAAIGAALLQSWRLDRATAALDAAERAVAAYQEAARISARVGADLAAQRDAATKLDHDLNTGGTDAPLSDYLRDAAGRLWR
jgi:hypothetical protein